MPPTFARPVLAERPMTTLAATEQQPEAATFSPTPVLAVACDVAAIGLLSSVMFSRIYDRELHMSRGFQWDRIALIMLAAGFVVLRRPSSGLGARGTLAAFSLVDGALALREVFRSRSPHADEAELAEKELQ